MVFSETLKALRDAKNLTQDQLAEKLDISRSAISMYERGEREPDFETLEVIADFFNVDMNKLIGKNTTTVLQSFNPHIEKYYQLNNDNQQTVNNLIDDLSEKQQRLDDLIQRIKEEQNSQTMIAALGGKNGIHKEVTDPEALKRIDELAEEIRKNPGAKRKK